MKSPNSCDSCLCLLLHWILHHGNDDSASHKWHALARSIGIQIEAPYWMPNASLSCHIPSAGRSGALRRHITMSMGPENLANTTPPPGADPRTTRDRWTGGSHLASEPLGPHSKECISSKRCGRGCTQLGPHPQPGTGP